MSLLIFINSGAFVRFTVDGWDPFAIENHKYSHESELQVYLKLRDGGIKPSQRWSSKKNSQITLACFLVVHFNHYYYSALHVLHAHTHYLYLGFFKSRYQLISAASGVSTHLRFCPRLTNLPSLFLFTRTSQLASIWLLESGSNSPCMNSTAGSFHPPLTL